MRVCLIYDCLFPYTVGGAERTYRSLAELLAADGHDVTYVTLRQWERGERADVPGVRVVTAGPRMPLYSSPGRRRVLPPIVFGLGVLWHLLRHGRSYEAVHCASFPYFSLLAAAAARPLGRYRLVVDWHEVWTQGYWREYLGPLAGRVGWLVQRVCARLPQRAFCFSRLHAQRLRDEGFRGEVTILPGEWSGTLEPSPVRTADPLVVFAGRHIPEKRVLTIPPAIAAARADLPELRGVILGDGPDRAELLRELERLGLGEVIEAPGFVDGSRVDQEIARALCMLLPSRREGYGLVVLEASAHGTPSVVVKDPDNAAVELIEEGENGFIVKSASPEDLAAAILRVHAGGSALRAATASWFARNAERHSLRRTLEIQVEAYGHALDRA
ncbi:MAG TPA: glycosyltransferase [Solirubrobacteraceae bacterium]|nr:glycosyltransferase [Solirubrobacteraceae bacterium]